MIASFGFSERIALHFMHPTLRGILRGYSRYSRFVLSNITMPYRRSIMISSPKEHAVRTWLDQMEHQAPDIRRRLSGIFGDGPALIAGRVAQYTHALRAFGEVYGLDRKVVMVRAPARINLMGVHIEHRGGWVNYMALSREIVMVAEQREDDVVSLRNVDERTYPPRSFRIAEELPPEKRGNWLKFIDEVQIQQGDWANYVKAAVLMLQDRQGNRPLRGLNLMVTGDIPSGAGLSSSSALVIATLEAALWANDLQSLSKEERVHIGGEGEWYVGTRGGSGDHAAMLFGQRGIVCHTRFFPLIVESVPFPTGYKVVACNSLREARKAAGARHIFNQRLTAYEIGLMWTRKQFPEYAPRLEHLRDINAEHLGVDEGRIYEILKTMPERLTRDEARAHLPNDRDHLEFLFRAHEDPPEGYEVRDVCAFGLAECARGHITGELLNTGRIEELGELMYISHDGDRVVSYLGDLRYGTPKATPWVWHATKARLDRLIQDARGKDPVRRERAHLRFQPGGYRCSCEELDLLVDLTKIIPGIMGAGLTGAGLGGSILVLVKDEAVEPLIQTLQAWYYEPKGLSPAIEVCSPVEGAGLL